MIHLFPGCLYGTWLRTSHWEKPFPWGYLSKTITGNWLTLGRRSWEDRMSVGGFEKLWHILGNQRLFEFVELWACWGYPQVHEKPRKTLISYLWMTLRLCANWKWRLRQSCQLPSMQKINKETDDLIHTINQLNIIDMYRTHQLVTAEYTLFLGARGIFSTIDHLLSHKTSLHMWKRIEII